MKEKFETVEAFLNAKGLSLSDVKKKFIKGGCEVYYPYIGEDGKAHLGTAVIKSSKEA